ncbi:type I polyketide synthase [Nostoc sp. UIC 10630]|uniref:type I polyketide synthase n=1 Tax=Nostoc sp. UIC 10630 TaxID=2100146 RepID=UPI0013D31D1E|nr:type I polyketide synthase [Nostoc sp. UIC 10630]NEU77734.1 acyltransferase domain-containing protein [Nostoc sp. UIC 10630]QID92145.1 polyketide synthase [Nostoc sp. UIC 10630]
MNGSEIAIVGLSGRFPGAKDVEEFWQNLQNGVNSVSFFSDEELLSSGLDPDVLKNPNYIKAASLLEDVELFDAAFFGFNPREAEITDPQHRLFLECAWQALENAGYNSEIYKGAIGVFGGSSLSSYLLNVYLNQNITFNGHQLNIAGDKDYLTTRVSYKLNLTGPSYTVQTACSTSLVAVHLACQSLLNGECDMALAGGVAIKSSRKGGYFYQEGGISSPDGYCRAFDAKAQGTVSGEGVGIVVLKRLEDAFTDRDCIHAVIKGSAINNDGSNKVSYTAPRIGGQAKVIRMAQVVAEVEPETITYIEAHGTGTSLGDPIEIAALTEVFQASTQKKGFCAIGSVKTNIGHLDAAAGVTGLIKTVLALKHKQIPPSLHFEKPNPQIDFANSPFYVNTALSPWEVKDIPRRAGVSSFGIGGTNAHVILEEAPSLREQGSRKSEEQGRNYQLLVLSAKTNSALETATTNLVDYLQQYPSKNLADIAYTLGVGRRTFDYRRMLVCKNIDDALKALKSPGSPEVFTHYQEPKHCPVAFMFSGQGTQYVNMGRELYETESIFREQIDDCCKLLQPHLGIDLRELLYPSATQHQEVEKQLKQTAIAQPALFVVEYALAQLWMAWGVNPQVMIGHSIGEYVAACLAGVFSLEDALFVVAMRGRLMQQVPAGAMLAVTLSQAELQPLLTQELAIAVYNTPSLCVVAGPVSSVEKLQHQLRKQGVECRLLHTSHAFHSPMMSAIIEPFTQLLQTVKLNPPKIPFLSNVSGIWITTAEATDPNYWAKHLRQPVRFSEGVIELLKQPERILLEVGPGRTLSSLVKQHQVNEQMVLTSIRHPQEQQSDVAFVLQTLGKLWLVGVQVDWSAFYAHQQCDRLPLPTYPFERQRYWIEANPTASAPTSRQEALHKKLDIADWFYIPRWQQSIPLGVLQTGELTQQKLCWLVFVDAYGIGTEVAKRLEQQGQNAIAVKVGEQFAQLSDGSYTINPEQRNDYHALLQALQKQGLIPQAIAHFWSVAPNDTFACSSLSEQTQYFDDCQKVGFYSLLFLAQALAEQNLTEPTKLMVVTSNVHDVTGEEKLCPHKATVIGSCKVIPQEYPHITCCHIDVVITAADTKPSEKLINQLVGEFTAESTENVIAYRGHHRWIQTYEAVRLDQSVADKTRLRKGGVYLITDGLGSVGLSLAEYLAQKVQAKLVLLGRTDLPAKEQWSQWLATNDEQDIVSCNLRKLQALEALGAEVLVISADVANEQQMHNAIATATSRFGDIHGVIHTAGNPENAHCAIQGTLPTETQLQFHSQVYGLFVLEKVLRNYNLDFCFLISSLSSVLGGLGFVSSSAASNFMDAFVYQYNQTNSCFWCSINWDMWKTKEEQLHTINEINSSQFFITLQEGIKAFERVLSMSGISQIVVSTGELQARIDQRLKLESLQKTKLSSQEDLFSNHQRPNLLTAYIAPRNEVEQTVAEIWQKLLGVEQIGIHDNFFELGGHSLLGTQVISHLRKAFLIDLPLRHLFDEPTITGISESIENIRSTAKKILVSASSNFGDREEIEL